MSEITVTSRQSLMDVALQHGGALDAIFDMAQANDRSLTDDLVAGDTLDVPEAQEPRVTQYYKVNNVMPATAITIAEINDILGMGEGIEFWGIEFDFIVQ